MASRVLRRFVMPREALQAKAVRYLRERRAEVVHVGDGRRRGTVPGKRGIYEDVPGRRRIVLVAGTSGLFRSARARQGTLAEVVVRPPSLCIALDVDFWSDA